MSQDPRIIELKSRFELVEISLPTNQTVVCVKQDSVLIPLAKVMIYGLGKSVLTDAEVAELAQLKRERRLDQRMFRASHKQNRLHDLQRREDNQRKSLENYRALLDVGIFDSVEGIKKIISHLLEVGTTVVASTGGGEMVRSQLTAPKGIVIVQSGWKIIENGEKYLTTIHFLPPNIVG